MPDKPAVLSDEEKIKELEKRYKQAIDKQGIISERRLGNISKSGFSTLKLLGKNALYNAAVQKNAVQLYKEGKITYEKALANIDNTEKTGEICTNVMGNIFTGFLATTAGIFLKGKYKLSLPVVMAIGTGIGAVAKTAYGILDRALNNIKGDEFDLKSLAKDAASGAVNGSISGFNAGFGKEFTAASVLKKIGFEIGKQGVMIGGAKLLSMQSEKEQNLN